MTELAGDPCASSSDHNADGTVDRLRARRLCRTAKQHERDADGALWTVAFSGQCAVVGRRSESEHARSAACAALPRWAASPLFGGDDLPQGRMGSRQNKDETLLVLADRALCLLHLVDNTPQRTNVLAPHKSLF
ncbi:hypothetical protein TOPH_07212 [Tolypocladium ophioglossoides CBS 100239]|uniref:Uncharacterized protein n=1 Tax=Tolypocladium ophioglossoides (strain CBS 100239) TaxID=1163406 RepID=A0A0L0N1Y5_TOLOC|nr:hypothetical protein TOPH_07212 [Tolypocladium ophioglossoides CBS 100239]